MPLTPTELNQFHQDGYLPLLNYLDKFQLLKLNNEIGNLLNNVDIENNPIIKFTTENDNEGHISDKYFLDSSDKISFFFEPDSIDNNNKLKYPINKSVNKIGHGLHLLNQTFNEITINDDIASICRQLAIKDARAVQSMVIIKQPLIGAKVPPHNDAEFLFTNPISCIGFWFALQDCTIENGCLEFLPNSHKIYPLNKRFVKDLQNGYGTKFANLNNLNSNYISNENDDENENIFNNDSLYKKIIIPAGTLVLIDGKIIHKSGKNLSNNSRNAYTFHIIDGTTDYDEYNWLQIPPNNPSGSKNFTRLYKNFE